MGALYLLQIQTVQIITQTIAVANVDYINDETEDETASDFCDDEILDIISDIMIFVRTDELKMMRDLLKRKMYTFPK